LPRLRQIGIRRFRLSPQKVDMVAAAETFRGALNGAIDAEEAAAHLEDICPDAEFANGYFHGQPGHTFVEAD
jgi:collagenase-like PrtC family protease